MKKKFIFSIVAFLAILQSFAQVSLDEKIPIRGLCIASPEVDGVDRFVKFVDEVLGPKS